MAPHRGSTVLVLGILSIVVCGICGPIAWVMANKDLAAMAAGAMDPAGLDSTKAGRICGIIGTAFLAIGLVVGVLYLIFFVVMVGAAVSQGSLQ